MLFICNLLTDPNEGEAKNNYLYYGNDPDVDEDVEWNDLSIEAIIRRQTEVQQASYNQFSLLDTATKSIKETVKP